MVDIRTIKTDLQATNEGKWVELPTVPGAKWLICAMSGKPVRERMAELQEEHEADLAPPDATATEEERTERQAAVAELTEELFLQAVRERLLLGWEGLTEKGEPYEYTQERAVEIMSSDSWAMVSNGLTSKAQLRFTELTEDELGNSLARSDDSSTGPMPPETPGEAA